METEELKQLIHAVSSSKLQEFQYEESGIKIAMKKGISSSGKAADAWNNNGGDIRDFRKTIRNRTQKNMW